MVELISPAADAAGRDGSYVSLKNGARAYIVCHITQGNAATVTLTPLQASAVAGTGAKVISNAVRVWSNLDCAASDSLVARTAATSYTTDAGVKHKIVVFEIDPNTLDTDNGFDCISIRTGASNAANITQAMVYLADYSFQGDSLVSAITD